MKMKKGFTLIELMVVIVIMGILAAVAVPKIFGNVDKAKLSGVGETLSQYEQATANYYILNSGLPAAAGDIDFNIADAAPFAYDWATTVNTLTITVDASISDCSSVSARVYTGGAATLESERLTDCGNKLTKVTNGDVIVLIP
jgi:prepilin-type N-terminal cleavage/methylation domain-containing protein